MRASSVGLETDIHITPSEMGAIQSSPLEGRLTFREVNEDTTRGIPFVLVYCPTQREFLEVRVDPPHTYFGTASNVRFSINEEFYTALLRHGSYGDRFWGSGKLLVFVEENRRRGS